MTTVNHTKTKKFPSDAVRDDDSHKPRPDLIDPDYLSAVIESYEALLRTQAIPDVWHMSDNAAKAWLLSYVWSHVESWVCTCKQNYHNRVRDNNDNLHMVTEASAYLIMTEYIDDIEANSDIFDETGYLGIAALPGDMLLRFGDHLGKGAAHYGDNNWRIGHRFAAGIDEKRYYESFIRHYNQYRRGDTDEDHFAACLFNLMGMWFVRVNHYRRHVDERNLWKVRNPNG